MPLNDNQIKKKPSWWLYLGTCSFLPSNGFDICDNLKKEEKTLKREGNF